MTYSLYIQQYPFPFTKNICYLSLLLKVHQIVLLFLMFNKSEFFTWNNKIKSDWHQSNICFVSLKFDLIIINHYIALGKQRPEQKMTNTSTPSPFVRKTHLTLRKICYLLIIIIYLNCCSRPPFNVFRIEHMTNFIAEKIRVVPVCGPEAFQSKLTEFL